LFAALDKAHSRTASLVDRLASVEPQTWQADNGEVSANRMPEERGPREAKSDRVSVIIPVKNEEASIESLLHGLVEQTYLPAEIVITDGGSSDRTREIINRFQTHSPVPVVLIEVDHAFPGKGRNLAIVRASNQWLACIDGGIVPHPNWLLELMGVKEDQPEAQVIYGRFEPVINDYFTECAAITYLPSPATLTPFIASCLLHRSAWETVGGFREDLRSSEDLLFFRSLAGAGVRTAKSEKAVVYWSLAPSISSTFRRFSTYSCCGMKAGLASDWQLSVSRLYILMMGMFVAGFLWPSLFLLPPLLLWLRAERRIRRWYRQQPARQRWKELLNPKRVLMVIWINMVIDVAMFQGMWHWLARREP
jgi:glycosyltransferase involved in cell wall biosynthesis